MQEFLSFEQNFQILNEPKFHFNASLNNMFDYSDNVSDSDLKAKNNQYVSSIKSKIEYFKDKYINIYINVFVSDIQAVWFDAVNLDNNIDLFGLSKIIITTTDKKQLRVSFQNERTGKPPKDVLIYITLNHDYNNLNSIARQHNADIAYHISTFLPPPQSFKGGKTRKHYSVK
jgi:hypothetical protein